MKPADRWWRRWVRRILILVTFCVFVALAGLGYLLSSLPAVAPLAEENPETTAFVELARRGGARPELIWVPYRAISSSVKKAVLVSEDINFFSHKGFALGEIATALRNTLQDGKPLRGASTLTQQLAKNLWLSPARTSRRKLEEAFLTMELERRLSKRRILELYLNVAQFGPGIFGVEAAARRFFDKPAASLGDREAAALAAALPRPSDWHPGSRSSTAQRRVERILRRMARAGWLDDVI